MKKKVLCLARYDDLGASSRVRLFQFYDSLSIDFKLTSQSLFSNKYLERKYKNNLIYLILVPFYYFRRVLYLLKHSRDYDILFIEKELFPYAPYFIESIFLRNSSYILDFDDAIIHNYNGESYVDVSKNRLLKNRLISFFFKNKIPKLIKNSKAVINGNPYLNNISKKYNHTESYIIPSSIDLRKYKIKKSYNTDKINVGWIGSPGSQVSLLEVAGIFEAIEEVNFIFVGANKLPFSNKNIIYKEWTESSEIDSLLEFDIGIMPLKNLSFQNGKCAYKLIQYMACGIPVIASPVGVNSEIIQDGNNGFLAINNEDWIDKIRILSNNQELRKKFSIRGRKLVEEQYTIQVNGQKISKIINSVG